jgi:hypothetical protein
VSVAAITLCVACERVLSGDSLDTASYRSEIGWECMDWTYLDRDRDQRWPLVTAVRNRRVP